MSTLQQILVANAVLKAPAGQQVITGASGTWTCPVGVYSVCAFLVGQGGGPTTARGGCGAGGAGYINDIPVVPGTGYSYTINTTGTTMFSRTAGAGETSSNVNGGASKANSGTFTAIFPGGTGGSGNDGGSGYGGGGAGAGGYSSTGGNGGGLSSSGGSGAGGGGGGGGGTNTNDGKGGKGGGVGLLGAGSNGAGGATGNPGGDGTAGSGGSGVTYGGGCGGNDVGLTQTPGVGAIRLIWGVGRAYPSTRTADE